MAPPTPCKARIPTSIGREVLSAHPTDATAKTAMAEMKTRRVPNLSAIHPLAGIRTANTRRYEETATLTSTASTPKDWAIDGSAVARIVASSISMNSAAATSSASPRGNVTAPEPFGGAVDQPREIQLPEVTEATIASRACADATASAMVAPCGAPSTIEAMKLRASITFRSS